MFSGVAEKHLVNVLSSVRNVRPGSRLRAVRCLTIFYANEVNNLAKLVPDADPNDLPIIVDALAAKGNESTVTLNNLFKERLLDYQDSKVINRAKSLEEKLANLAICLWHLGSDDAICRVLQHNPDPTLQTATIHRLADEQIQPTVFWDALSTIENRDGDNSTAVRFAVLQVLGLISQEIHRTAPRIRILEQMYANETDSGVHSSIRHLANRLNYDLSNVSSIPGSSRWMQDEVGGTFQDFAIIEPCTAELGEVDNNNWAWPKHKRKFERRFAIATNEVTIKQFRALCG